MSISIESLNISLFVDGADLESVLEQAKNPHIKGFTTNPTLMRAAGVNDYRAFAKELLSHVTDRPISFEVFADDFPNMRRQALEIASWADNIHVKIPITNSLGEPSAPLIRDLADQGVPVNVTAVFSLAQVRTACEALKGGPSSIVSVFAGRVADSGRDPIPHMAAARALCRGTDPNIQLLWASPREVLNVIQADQVGCDIITATPSILKKITLFGKDLEDFSLDTVLMFKNDAEAAGYSL